MQNKGNIMNILLVNPISSAQYMANRLKNYQIKTTAIYTVSKTKFTPYSLPKNAMFDEEIWLEDYSANDIIKHLHDRNFDYILNGHEKDLATTDRLAQHFTPAYANEPNTSHLRNDKYFMHKILQQHKIKHIQQQIIDKNDLTLLKEQHLNYPLFIKPLSGSGGNGARKIDSYHELSVYFDNSHAENIQDLITEFNAGKFLLADFVQGREVLVDSFSKNGMHYISSIQAYQRTLINNTPIALSVDLLHDSTLYNLVVKYITEVLSVTGFNNGFAHTELFILENNEVVLIEINPRISGIKGFHNILAEKYGLLSQIDLLAQHVYKKAFLANDQQKNSYNKLVFFYNHGASMMNDLKHDLESHIDLKGVHYSLEQLVKSGSIIKSNVDSLDDVKGFALFSSENLKQLEHVVNTALTLDSKGFKNSKTVIY